jgi:hypothetical protein
MISCFGLKARSLGSQGASVLERMQMGSRSQGSSLGSGSMAVLNPRSHVRSALRPGLRCCLGLESSDGGCLRLETFWKRI